MGEPFTGLDEQNSDRCGSRIRSLLEDLVRRLDRGEAVTDAELIAAHPELMPELGKELAKLRRIQAAKARAVKTETRPARTYLGKNEGASELDADALGFVVSAQPNGQEGDLSDEENLPATASAAMPPHQDGGGVRVDVGSRSPTLPTDSFPGYQITREIHRGGQGVVYQAIQEGTRRKVAIKVLLEGPFAGQAARRRFEREIELVARLKHPNIVEVFHSGTTAGGRQYCVMDYVRGMPLDQFVRSQKLPLEEALQLFGKVCEAVNYANQRGVIHRDLKPTNILVNSEGIPKVLDFGLAKMLAGPDETLVSVTGQVIGTLPYMSPEQARGNPDEVDIRTDVYALGVILYEVLTGQYPYPVIGQMADVLRHIAETPPASPSRVWSIDSGVVGRTTRRLRKGQCPIDRELETIILSCLSKYRERRYQSAGDLQKDVSRYLDDEPIEARRDSVGYLVRRQLRRHKARVEMFALIVLVLGVPLFALGISYEDLRRDPFAWHDRTKQEFLSRFFGWGRQQITLEKAWVRAATVKGWEELPAWLLAAFATMPDVNHSIFIGNDGTRLLASSPTATTAPPRMPGPENGAAIREKVPWIESGIRDRKRVATIGLWVHENPTIKSSLGVFVTEFRGESLDVGDHPLQLKDDHQFCIIARDGEFLYPFGSMRTVYEPLRSYAAKAPSGYFRDIELDTKITIEGKEYSVIQSWLSEANLVYAATKDRSWSFFYLENTDLRKDHLKLSIVLTCFIPASVFSAWLLIVLGKTILRRRSARRRTTEQGGLVRAT